MIYFKYFLLILCLRNSQNYAQAEIEVNYKQGSDEFSFCDYSQVESQLESLKSGNEFLKLRLEKVHLQVDKHKDVLQELGKKIDGLTQSLESMERKILAQDREHFSDVNDLFTKQDRVLQNRYQEPPADDKWHLLSDIKNIVKDHHVLLENFGEKLKNVDDILQKASWETYMHQMGDSISKNLTILQNIDKKLNNLETTTATKIDQIAFNRNIQKYFNKNEVTKICLKDENQKLICTNQPYPTSCADFNAIYCANNKCRLYNHLYGPETFLASCEDQTDGGGWTVIQRRINGSVDFYRDWSDYKQGFGNIDGEFFIGLDKLHALTTNLQPMELMIQLKDFNDTMKYAKYDEFIVGNETEKYILQKVGKYSGDAGDSFSFHQGSKFSTKDNDNDLDQAVSCAIDKKGAWWYRSCMWSNLNGKYFDIDKMSKGSRGICWSEFHGYEYSMKFVQMMIRPKRI